MLSVLALASLALASASEGESPDEKAWIERFEAIDRRRAEFGIPPLSPRERMAMMLGKGPVSSLYYIDVLEDEDRERCYRIMLYRWVEKKKGRADWVEEKELPCVVFADYIGSNDEAYLLAKSLYLPMNPPF